MREALIVHFWIAWAALDDEPALKDAFNGFFNGFIVGEEIKVLETVQDRFRDYNEAIGRDEEQRARGLMAGNLTRTALRWLLAEDKPEVRFLTSTEVGLRLWSIVPTVREFMEKIRIGGS
jgi:hypothetical protein